MKLRSTNVDDFIKSNSKDIITGFGKIFLNRRIRNSENMYDNNSFVKQKQLVH